MLFLSCSHPSSMFLLVILINLLGHQAGLRWIFFGLLLFSLPENKTKSVEYTKRQTWKGGYTILKHCDRQTGLRQLGHHQYTRKRDTRKGKEVWGQLCHSLTTDVLGKSFSSGLTQGLNVCLLILSLPVLHTNPQSIFMKTWGIRLIVVKDISTCTATFLFLKTGFYSVG